MLPSDASRKRSAIANKFQTSDVARSNTLDFMLKSCANKGCGPYWKPLVGETWDNAVIRVSDLDYPKYKSSVMN